MSQETGTYKSLILLERDIDANRKASPAFNYFLKRAIKFFYDKNGPRLQAARLRLNELISGHVLHDEQFQPVTVPTEKGEKEYVFLTPADQAEYTAKYEALMNQQIDIFY